jgi:diketogulonate reductase-like aldo/keto reductase
MNIPDPKTFTDPEKLRKLMANAVRLGYPDLVFNCQLRLAELVGATHEKGLEREFWTALSAAEEFATAAKGKTARLTKIRAKHKRVGAQKVMADWAMEEAVSEGFLILAEHGRADLSAEAIVMRNEELFSVDAVNAMRKKLMDHNVSAERVEAVEPA